MSLLCANLYSQSSVSGIVSDESGEPLSFATVAVGTMGASTDLEGKYTLDLAAGEHELTVSYVGYETAMQTITLSENQQLELNFTLSLLDNMLQEATVTSSRFEKPLGEVTVSMDVLKSELVNNTNTIRVDEAIDKVPGVNILDGQANIRGGAGFARGSGSRVLMLVDGLPALKADAGSVNWDDIPVESVERIEVVKGASSALYGSSALNGIINIQTAYATDQPETHISGFNRFFLKPRKAEQAHWENAGPVQTGMSISHAQKFNQTNAVFSGRVLYADDPQAAVFNRSARLGAKLKHDITNQLSIGLNTGFNIGKIGEQFFWQNEKEGAYLPFAGSDSEIDFMRLTIDPSITYFDTKGNRHQFLSRYYFINNDQTGNRRSRSDFILGDYQFSRSFEEFGGFDLVAGATGNYTKTNTETFGNAEYGQYNMAAFAQLDKRLFNKLTISGGARYELNTLISPDSIIDPNFADGTKMLNASPRKQEAKPVFRVGLNYELLKGTYMRASWGQGYRYPSIAEQFVFTNVSIISVRPNPLLESETGWSGELGIKQGFKISEWQGYIDIAGFWTEYSNMIEFTFNADNGLYYQSQNVGDTEIQGLELTVVGQGSIAGVDLRVLSGYTYINPSYKEFTDRINDLSSADFNVLKYRSRHTFKFDGEATYQKMRLGVSANYASQIEAIDSAIEFLIPGVADFRREHDAGYLVFNARLAYEMSDQASLAIIAKNLFNAEYTVRPAKLEAPLNLTLRADYTF